MTDDANPAVVLARLAAAERANGCEALTPEWWAHVRSEPVTADEAALMRLIDARVGDGAQVILRLPEDGKTEPGGGHPPAREAESGAGEQGSEA